MIEEEFANGDRKEEYKREREKNQSYSSSNKRKNR